MKEDDEVAGVQRPKLPPVALGSGTVALPASGSTPGSGWSAPPTIAAALAALAPRTQRPGEPGLGSAVVIDAYRRFAFATTILAIAQGWDTGRLAMVRAGSPPFEDEVYGLAGWRSGNAASQLGDAEHELERNAAFLTQVHATYDPPPLHVFCEEHGVGPIGERLLLFILAPSLWGELARLYGILSNDLGRPTIDEHLLCQLLGDTIDRREIARQLDRDSPLLQQGLIRAGSQPRPFQSLIADPVLVKVFAGESIDEDPEPGIALVPATIPLEQLVAAPGLVDRALADLALEPAGRARIVVRGRRGSGRRTWLATLAKRAGRTLATIDATRLLRERRVDELTTILQRMHLHGWLPCIDGLDSVSSEDALLLSMVRERIAMHRGPLAVRLLRHTTPPLEPGYVVIDLPALTVAERAELWAQRAGELGMVLHHPDELAARFPVGAGTITRVVRAVAPRAPVDVDRALTDSLRQHVEVQMSSLATRVTRLPSWSQVALPTEIADSIAELIARVRYRRVVYDTWGFEQVMSTSRGLTALFQGGPGTGKTLVAGALAHELGLDLYRVDLARVVSKWVGETEKNLAEVLDAAEEGHALLLFDEADAIFARRTEVHTALDRYSNLEVNYLLQRLDSFEGVVVLTTNLQTSIDPALKRRLTCQLTFPFPDEGTRERLWRMHLPAQLPCAGELDLAGLARRYQMSGGYIRNAAIRAAFLAAQDHTPLSQLHLERAIRAEFREAGKPLGSGVLE